LHECCEFPPPRFRLPPPPPVDPHAARLNHTFQPGQEIKEFYETTQRSKETGLVTLCGHRHTSLLWEVPLCDPHLVSPSLPPTPPPKGHTPILHPSQPAPLYVHPPLSDDPPHGWLKPRVHSAPFFSWGPRLDPIFSGILYTVHFAITGETRSSPSRSLCKVTKPYLSHTNNVFFFLYLRQLLSPSSLIGSSRSSPSFYLFFPALLRDVPVSHPPPPFPPTRFLWTSPTSPPAVLSTPRPLPLLVFERPSMRPPFCLSPFFSKMV